MEEFERTHFRSLGYHIVDSGMKTEYRFNERPKISSLNDFFSARYHGSVRLIYADEDREEELRAKALACGYEDS